MRERYGVEPRQVPDFIALRGDPSDKIPGARGVGPKGAASLLQQISDLEDALADGRFTAKAEELRLYGASRRWSRGAAAGSGDQQPTWDKAAALASAWELRQLAMRLGELAGAAG